ncbi:HVA22-like protein e [Hibiscus syriacus]|uniref:HVA22-like protein e n=1 Tax=Hibiscus syriacus TaxID=106335 RepID=UPI0019227CF9|nr:HVA22-like protein e [Hibiscus syriacus]
MSRFWTFLTSLHSLAGPLVMLLYPLYASVIAIESPGKEDDEQWLAYWILYSFLTLTEMVFESVLEWIPIWYSAKLLFIAWLVLPQFKGATFIYERLVREQIVKYGILRGRHPDGKGKKKGEQEAS